MRSRQPRPAGASVAAGRSTPVMKAYRNQRLGDRIAETVVVRTRSAPAVAGKQDTPKADVRFSMGRGSDFVDT